jgi:hypothetical protein
MGCRPVGRERQDAGHTARSCFVWPRHLQRVTYLLAYSWAYCKRAEGPSVFQASQDGHEADDARPPRQTAADTTQRSGPADAARQGRRSPLRVYGGGRTWWAHFAFTRIKHCANYPLQKDRGFGRGARFSVWQSTTAASAPHDVGLVFAVAMASRRTTVSDAYRAPPRALPKSID